MFRTIKTTAVYPLFRSNAQVAEALLCGYEAPKSSGGLKISRGEVMTYSYSDSNSFLGHGPSIGGAVALLHDVERLAPKASYPHLHNLLETGECDDPKAVQGECTRLMKKVTDDNVKDTLSRLARACAQSKDKIIIHH